MTGMDHEKKEDALMRQWANDTPQASEAFLKALAQIPQDYPQASAGWFKRALKAVGGWGFATPQLAGLVLAAGLGIASGSQADVDYVEDNLASAEMSDHIFGADTVLEG